MSMMELDLMQKLAVWALPVIFAITLHEVAHGWMAEKLGDPTARMLGRITLNPIKHIDPIGTIIVPAALLVLGGFVFGWAKAVPVTTQNFKHPRRDMAIVAMAGPASNFLMALFWALILKIGLLLEGSNPDISQFLFYSGVAGVTINLVLMVLNLLPIPPLDGSRVLAWGLPKPWAWQLMRFENYGFLILVAMMFLGVLSPLILGPFSFFQHWIYALFNI